MKQFLFSFFALLLLLGVGGFLLIYSGLYSVAATAEHTAFERWVLETAKRQSVAQAARDVDVPDLEDHAAILRGAGSYQAMCLTCHGAPGVERSAMGRGLNPLAPEPEEMLRLWSPEEMFWITKNGIRMTGMPAWGATHTEEELWELVAFIQEVEGMTPEEYEAIVADAPEHEHDHDHNGGGEHGHDAPEHDHDHNGDGEHGHGDDDEHAEEEHAHGNTDEQGAGLPENADGHNHSH